MPGAQVITTIASVTPARRARPRASYDHVVVVDPLDMVDPAEADAATLVAIAGGDQSALGELYERYGRMVHSIAYRITRDAQAAEECTQDAFMAVWRSASSFDPLRSKPATWLCAIARNRALGLPETLTNAALPPSAVEAVAAPDPDGTRLLRDAAETLRLSARGYHRVIRTARTLADLDGEKTVRRLHVAEALSYRSATVDIMAA